MVLDLNLAKSTETHGSHFTAVVLVVKVTAKSTETFYSIGFRYNSSTYV